MTATPQHSTASNDRTEPSPQRQEPSQRVWKSEQLLGDEVEVCIEHNGQTYRLRKTRNGKLILIK